MNGFNIRVYAFCVHDGKLLTLHENYAGTPLLKLPGGGLEFGEGTLDCLHREFMEELNLTIEVLDHVYTQEQMVPSLIKDGKQLLTIYYEARILDPSGLKVNEDTPINHVEWKDLSQEVPLGLPSDQWAFHKFLSVRNL